MNFTIYKPNSKNNGSAFSFSVNKGSNNKTVLFVSMIQQYGWNDNKKTGSFKENSKNKEKSATIALSAVEAGEILSSFKTRIPFLAFHRKGDDTTIIKFTPWDKKRKIKEQNGDKFYETPAFGICITRNSSQTFKIPLEAGETEVLSELLKEFIKQSFELPDMKKGYKKNTLRSSDTLIADLNAGNSSNYNKKQQTEESAELEDDDVPF